MRHVSVISGHPLSTGFHGLTGCQRDPRNRGVSIKFYIFLNSMFLLNKIILNKYIKLIY